MKNLTILAIMAVLILLGAAAAAQTADATRPTVAVLNIDTKNLSLTPEEMGNLTRLELDKLGMFDVMDRYDVAYMIESKGISIDNCYGKICVVEVGKKLGMDKMLTGNVEKLEEIIIVNLRLIDVASGAVEKSQVLEFLDITQQLQMMVSLTMHKMFDLKVDEDILSKLTQEFDFENTLNYPDADRLNLNGPRSGIVFYTGETGRIYQSPKDQGGFDGYPVLFQFGYQFETKYINAGNFQALFEVIPSITGLDQGRVVPSVSILNGLRHNKIGWEFAFGPIFIMNKQAKGFYDEINGGEWILEEDWIRSHADAPTPYPVVKRLDSRGKIGVSSGFLFGLGKTIKSGRLNIPLNAFVIPAKDGTRIGFSVGFNASRYRR
jgi:TolB-like protein